jgi:hypothetical protein
MTTNYKVNTSDLSTIFAPYNGLTNAAATGYHVGGADLNTIFSKLSYGTSAAATGIKVNGVDLNTFFAAFGSVSFPNSWTTATIGAGSGGVPVALAWLNNANFLVAYGNSATPNIFYSTTGTSFSLATNPAIVSGTSYFLLGYGPSSKYWVGGVTTVASVENAPLMISATTPSGTWTIDTTNLSAGTNWTNGQQMPYESSTLVSAAVAAGGSSPFYSANGTTWTASTVGGSTTPEGLPSYRRIIWDGSQFVTFNVISGTTNIYTSPTGTTFTLASTLSGVTAYSICYSTLSGLVGYFISGAKGYLAYSAGLTSWTPISSAATIFGSTTGDIIYDMATGNGKLILVGTGTTNNAYMTATSYPTVITGGSINSGAALENVAFGGSGTSYFVALGTTAGEVFYTL